jgi:hypothetical protein
MPEACFQNDVTTANNQTLAYPPANRLQNANGPWGAKTFYYDGTGNAGQSVLWPPIAC